MPGTMTYTLKDGQKVNVPVKWSSEEVEQMDRQQLLAALGEARDFACIYDAEYQKPYAAANDALRRTQGNITNAEQAKLLLILAAIVAVVGVVLLAMGHSSLGPLVLVVAVCLMVISVWYLIKLKTMYRPRYAEQKSKIDELVEAAQNFQRTEAGATARVLWPDEYTNPAALQFAINAIQNHRGSTLGQVIELWEQEKQNEAVRAALERQVQAQYATAQAARDTARYAAAAATAASVSARHDIHDNN